MAIRVEVVYALPERQQVIALRLPAGSTVADAIAASSIGDYFPGSRIDTGSVGIWAERVCPERVLADGDRVEIYRPLVAEPREARRRLAAAGRAMGQHETGDH